MAITAQEIAKRNGDEGAFTRQCDAEGYGEMHGLTKREYFAAMAMQGIVSDLPGAEPSKIAITAVLIADSLLLELSK